MNALLGILRSNWGVKLVSVFVAAVIWFGIFGSKSIEVSKEVSVRLEKPEGLVESNDFPKVILVRLSGPKAFLRSLIDRKEEPVVIPFGRKEPGIHTYRFPLELIPLPLGVRVLSIQPQYVTLKLDVLRRRAVPIRVEVEGDPSAGFEVYRVTAIPNAVRLKGPRASLLGMQQAMARPFPIGDARETIKQPLEFDNLPPGVELDGPSPSVMVEIGPARPKPPKGTRKSLQTSQKR